MRIDEKKRSARKALQQNIVKARVSRQKLRQHPIGRYEWVLNAVTEMYFSDAHRLQGP